MDCKRILITIVACLFFMQTFSMQAISPLTFFGSTIVIIASACAWVIKEINQISEGSKSHMTPEEIAENSKKIKEALEQYSKPNDTK